ncbi:GNAT family N-acetyltransferase [Pseudoalteromonas luteoviolacea]|uniref:GNAT family N-acetyltransferase n=1 Tax=Pseudoalteromonas luteoviolacea TaxID=43657 RepID=UPI001F479680|nr:GNAT family N-acetyltransferase [Pseudoalteromonas luteoviolacea]MCF6440606.1 GNAT family N-acetyltransferase [Pseudoalteromonas luteoviolacea]
MAIQNSSYHELDAENLEVLRSKYEISPDTCFVCLANNGAVLGYLLSHPWSGISPPKLFEPLNAPENSDHLYLHDLAISPDLKEQGLGRSLVLKLFEVARLKGICRISLVAVQGADSFWSRVGFYEVAGVNVCSSYGENAVLMEKCL